MVKIQKYSPQSSDFLQFIIVFFCSIQDEIMSSIDRVRIIVAGDSGELCN